MPNVMRPVKHRLKQVQPFKKWVERINTLTQHVKNLEQELNEVKNNPRYYLSYKYLHGNGIEIGAKSNPLGVPADAKVKYVDHLPQDELEAKYAKIPASELTKVDIVDDAETLTNIKNSSQDFIVANHLLEHTRDPITSIANMTRKLRTGGILYMAIPEKRGTFDLPRKITTYQELSKRIKVAPIKFIKPIYREWAKLVEKRRGGIEARVEELTKEDSRIHFNVWTDLGIAEFFARTIKDMQLPLEIETFMKNGHEIIVVLRKLPAKRAETF